MKKKIKQICKKLEREYKIKILFAVENGSRAWRISSKDSDYDVRFVFHRKTREYLSLNKKPEVIEKTYEDIDIVGFDIFKFCRLLSSSNPTCIEWLMTDIVYYGKQNKVFQEFAEKHFDPQTLHLHYKSMCKNNYLKYLASSDNVTYKRYFYCLRGMINAKYVYTFNEVPLINFIHTLMRIDDWDGISEQIYKTIMKIIELKKQQKEVHIIRRFTKIDLEIEKFINDTSVELPTVRKSIDILDKEIKRILKK